MCPLMHNKDNMMRVKFKFLYLFRHNLGRLPCNIPTARPNTSPSPIGPNVLNLLAIGGNLTVWSISRLRRNVATRIVKFYTANSLQ